MPDFENLLTIEIRQLEAPLPIGGGLPGNGHLLTAARPISPSAN
jgi:hypothetical protein